MLTRKLVDYVAMPVGTVTKLGIVEVCERCGKPGVHITFFHPQFRMEKWLHSRQFRLFTHGPDSACIWSRNDDGKEGWGWQKG